MIFKTIFFIISSVFLLSFKQLYSSDIDTVNTCFRSPKNSKDAVKCARCYLKNDKAEKALKYIKESLSYHPLNKNLNLLLAKIYLTNNNNLWAQKTLYTYSKKVSSDSEISEWLIWCYINGGQIEKAEKVLKKLKSTETWENITRQNLFSSLINFSKNNMEEARLEFNNLRAKGSFYNEDVALYNLLANNLYLFWKAPVHISSKILSGFNTNPATTSSFGLHIKERGSSYSGATINVNFEPILSRLGRPFISLSAKTLYYNHKDAFEYSYFIPEISIGLKPNRLKYFIVPSYHAGAFLLNSPYISAIKDTLWFEKALLPKNSHWFYEFHRLELDMLISKNRTILGGFGRRLFNHMSRSRWEGDATFIAPIFSSEKIYSMCASSFRYQKAEIKKYNMLGGTALVSGKYNFNRKFDFLINFFCFYDYFPEFSSNSTRRDILISIRPGFGFKINNSLLLNLFYEFNSKQSNFSDYSYKSQNIKVVLKHNGRFSLLRINNRLSKNRITLPYKTKNGNQNGGINMIRDLLKQREDIYRSSTCID